MQSKDTQEGDSMWPNTRMWTRLPLTGNMEVAGGVAVPLPAVATDPGGAIAGAATLTRAGA